jgi:hypothetical protein
LTARHLSYVAIAGAAVIVAVSFVMSAGAVIDYAKAIGVDHRLAIALPVCLEAVIVVAAAVRVARRLDELARSGLAGAMFFGAIAVSLAVNVAHGGPDPIAAALSGIPALSLPASLHLALEEWLRVRNTPRTTRKAKKTPRTLNTASGISRKLDKPPAVEAAVSGPPANGHAPRKLTRREVADRYPTLTDIEALIAEHDGNMTTAAKAIPTNRSALYGHIETLKGANA